MRIKCGKLCSSPDSIADIATKVSREFCKLNLETSGDDEDNDFEFVSLSTAGDEVFLNGAQIGPVFPVFNRDLLLGTCEEDRRGDRFALGDEEEVPDPPSSSSSSCSEADELDGIPPGTYCVWTPKGVPPSPARCEKSKSTGSCSRRWRFRDLLRRSHSDGKESFVFLTPSFGSRKSPTEDNKTNKAEEKPIRKSGSAVSAAGKGKNMAAAHQVFYVKNRALNQKAEKRRSTFLPYRRDLVGFFANVNTVGKTFPPF
ncbi:uncharacterized protein LOC112093992 [Morus notabilis]|uniref:uncharacterized protein LOC112093992 n=1 Tax=Morus notabilis TaxID=981085 RepID=UPI000CED02DA|nr:uncharacterized protein LOC112093992 [Morus notabilis]